MLMKELLHFKKLIEDFGYKRKYVFAGRIPNDEIPT